MVSANCEAVATNSTSLSSSTNKQLMLLPPEHIRLRMKRVRSGVYAFIVLYALATPAVSFVWEVWVLCVQMNPPRFRPGGCDTRWVMVSDTPGSGKDLHSTAARLTPPRASVTLPSSTHRRRRLVGVGVTSLHP